MCVGCVDECVITANGREHGEESKESDPETHDRTKKQKSVFKSVGGSILKNDRPLLYLHHLGITDKRVFLIVVKDSE